MRALLAPYNFAGQPVLVTQALRARGVDAQHLLYAWKWRASYFGYEMDRVVELNKANWLSVQFQALNDVIAERPDVVHLWNRSLIAPPGGFSFFSGMDLPYLKAAGIPVIYRFTGYDLRIPTLEKQLNPFSPLLHGYEVNIDEEAQRHYHAHLRQWVDAFVVQDPEMQAFMPDAEMIPRGIDLDRFEYVGVEPTRRPLIVHAPSSQVIKGTEGVLAAVETLRGRGLEFDFQLIEQMGHAEAVDWYRRADVIIDGMRIGWYAVLGVEGMALGKPVVTYIRPGLEKEIDRPLPVVSANLDTLADRLEDLIRDPDGRVERGRRSRRFAEEVHDVRNVAAQLEALYRRVIENPRVVTQPAPAYLRSQAESHQDVLVRAQRYDAIRGEFFSLRYKAKRAAEEAESATVAGHEAEPQVNGTPSLPRRVATGVVSEALERVPVLQDAVDAAPWLLTMARRDPVAAARVVSRRVRREAMRARRRRGTPQ
jgi:glycosyltransferase involved in cell wall biosynthesis